MNGGVQGRGRGDKFNLTCDEEEMGERKGWKAGGGRQKEGV
jgi:hypothetical protein